MKSLNKTGWISVFVISALIYGAIFGSDDEPAPVATPTPTVSQTPVEEIETPEEPEQPEQAAPKKEARGAQGSCKTSNQGKGSKNRIRERVVRLRLAIKQWL